MSAVSMGEMNFPQTPILSFLSLWRHFAASANNPKIKEGGPGEFIPLVIHP
jgi:hypothetical protein